ncbi:MAG: hypothetical protein SWO11_20005 [Thermodesulfobacteriota bacterium]|nr:hypothetical protein [Thermodesulfobacteriota bacterium]
MLMKYKYAWHTPGHMGGEGFLKSPSGTAFHKFFGEDVLRADLSISVPELGSLLDHSGVTGEAEKYSAKVFGADQTFYVLNGTSTANQIIWRSKISPKEHTLVDRNCHKSLNYAMVITDAKPQYMVPLRNKLGIIGPVDFSTFGDVKCPELIKMSALTNSTYDGVCYNTEYVKNKLYEHFNNLTALHFDEAWYAYAKFHPIYKKHFGMELPAQDIPVFCSQSTHKLLTAFSQASMLHIKLPKTIATETEKKRFHDLFNESYMMHGSTSPQYNMVASLEVATKMMEDNGEQSFRDTIEEAVELRKKIVTLKNDYENEKNPEQEKKWFFGIWQPTSIEQFDTEELIHNQKLWVIKKEDKDEWHGFDVDDDYAMLDPIKLTFTCPGINIEGDFEETGIPAAIVTNYLIDKGIVCEKSDYYSWLLLNSLGTTKGKQGTLLAELLKFKELYDGEALLEDVFPGLVAQYPDKYKGLSLRQHCQKMHEFIKKGNETDDMLKMMDDAYNERPEQKYTPAEAYRKVVKGEVERVELREIKNGSSRIAGVMLVPYPPGIPIAMGGELIGSNSGILDYLLLREKFENEFPGYESDIHGIERIEPDNDGMKYFQTFVIKSNYHIKSSHEFKKY